MTGVDLILSPLCEGWGGGEERGRKERGGKGKRGEKVERR